MAWQRQLNLVREQELARGEHGPPEVLDNLPAVACGVHARDERLLLLGTRHGSALTSRCRPQSRGWRRGRRTTRRSAVRVSQLLVQRVPVDRVQRLRQRGIHLPLCRRGEHPFGAPEHGQKVRIDIRVGQLQGASARGISSNRVGTPVTCENASRITSAGRRRVRWCGVILLVLEIRFVGVAER